MLMLHCTHIIKMLHGKASQRLYLRLVKREGVEIKLIVF